MIAQEGPLINSRNGVVVLSNTSGVYPSLKQGVISVSPADLEGTSDALARAISLTPEDRESKQILLRNSIQAMSLSNWLSVQFTDLLDI